MEKAVFGDFGVPKKGQGGCRHPGGECVAETRPWLCLQRRQIYQCSDGTGRIRWETDPVYEALSIRASGSYRFGIDAD